MTDAALSTTTITSRSDGGAPAASPWKRALLYALLVAVSFLMLYPLLWMVASSFKPDSEIFETIEKWLSTKTKFEAVDILRKYDIPCAPVLSMKEIAADKSLRESGTIAEVDHKQRGKYLTVGSPIKFSDMKVEITGSPLLGEHTDEVLAELGYSKDTIKQLHEAKAV